MEKKMEAKIPQDKTVKTAPKKMTVGTPVGKAVNVGTMSAGQESGTVSYDELNTIAHQLQHQNEQLKREVTRLYNEASLVRLQVLMQIVEHPDNYTTDMVEEALQEIYMVVFPKVTEEGDKENK